MAAPKEFNIKNKTILIKLVDLWNKPFDCIIENNMLKHIGAVIDLLNNKISLNNTNFFLHGRWIHRLRMMKLVAWNLNVLVHKVVKGVI